MNNWTDVIAWNEEGSSGHVGQYIELARLAAGKTQRELAERLGITQARMSQIEKSADCPDNTLFMAIQTLFGMPENFFLQEMPACGHVVHFRRKVSDPMIKVKRFVASVNIINNAVKLMCRNVDRQIPFDDPRCPEGTGIEEAVSHVKQLWGINENLEGTLDIAGLLESKGCILVDMPLDTFNIDAITVIKDGSSPVIIFNRNSPPDRTRFTLAHELGHLCMHRDTAVMEHQKEVEQDANEFASRFLMPEAVLKRYLNGEEVRLRTLFPIKVETGMSVAALVQAARLYKIIDQTKTKSLQIQIARYGYRINEPKSDELEEIRPRLFNELVESLKEKCGNSVDKFAESICLSENYVLNSPLFKNSFTPSTP